MKESVLNNCMWMCCSYTYETISRTYQWHAFENIVAVQRRNSSTARNVVLSEQWSVAASEMTHTPCTYLPCTQRTLASVCSSCFCTCFILLSVSAMPSSLSWEETEPSLQLTTPATHKLGDLSFSLLVAHHWLGGSVWYNLLHVAHWRIHYLISFCLLGIVQ